MAEKEMIDKRELLDIIYNVDSILLDDNAGPETKLKHLRSYINWTIEEFDEEGYKNVLDI